LAIASSFIPLGVKHPHQIVRPEKLVEEIDLTTGLGDEGPCCKLTFELTHTLPPVRLLFYFTFIHLADVFIQSDLQLLCMSEVARLWSD